MAEAPQEETPQNEVLFAASPTQEQPKPIIKGRRSSVDKDAQEMVIDSLRSQIQDLISQVSQLNNKLVKSYDRVSDLEDDLHVASANSRKSSVKISQLELERTQHLSALNTGLLVEKSHVTTELNRLMEKATEEAAQRGQAESARLAIEKDLDDLSATLFGQANTMVAEARYARHLSERKVEDAERALKSAEEAVQLMQAQMQMMQAEREDAEHKAKEMEAMMGKGKWVDRRDGSSSVSLRLFKTHSPYQDYLAFLAHLRVLHPTSPSPPAMSTLLPLPFLARLLTEDSEPTVRLDLAPSLNWLSRRSVLTAIHSGQLSIEPISVASLFTESSAYPSTTIAGVNSTNDNISCALCGCQIFQAPDSSSSHSHSNNPYSTASWTAGSFFRRPSLGLTSSNGNSQPPSPTRASAARRTSIGPYLNSQVYIFRLASTQSTGMPSLSIPSLPKSTSQSIYASSPNPSSSTAYTNGVTHHGHASTPSNSQAQTIYPLCMSGWCLARLRTTCTLWAFVRTGIVDKVWEEEIVPHLPTPPPHHPSSAIGPVGMEKSVSTGTPSSEKPPPIPPRKRGLWGIASAIGERAASWSESDKEKSKRHSTLAAGGGGTGAAHVPHPPPTPEKSPRRLPPPLPPTTTPAQPTLAPVDSTQAPPAHPATPPPLPRRSTERNTHPGAAPPGEATASSSVPETQPSTSPSAPTTTLAAPSDTPSVPPLSPIRGTHLRTASQGLNAPSTAPPLPPRGHARTPSTVALPDSRPGTPVGAGPSRTASPAPGAGVPGAPPPPIPRRAAARARVTAGGSRSTTPANAEAAVPAEDKKDAGPSTIVDGAPLSAEPEVALAAAAAPSDGKEAVDVIPDRSTVVSPGSDEFVDAPTGQEADEIAPALELADAEHSQTTKVNGADEPAAGETTPTPEVHLNGDLTHTGLNGHGPVNGVSVDQKAAAAEAEAEALAIKGRQEKERADAEAEVKKRKEEEEFKAFYVGDSTWEEKTWKELMRLREDMFWARVGGLRE